MAKYFVMDTNFNIKVIVKRLAKDDKKALDELYNIYYPRLYAFAKKFLKVEDQINDIIQDVFIKLWENRNKIKSHDTFNSWIFTITKNAIITYFREKIKEDSFHARVKEMATSNIFFIDNSVEYNDIKEKVDLIVDQLPDKRKQVFILSREQGLSNKEIADKLSISIKTVEDHNMHAIKFLRKHLKALDIVTLLYLAIFL
jgi:RNA polymerase sigma-70 factor (ECF subfamily)